MTEQGERNLMDELRHVQLLLKREEIFNEFQQTEIQELNTNLRTESQRVFSLQKLLLYLHMCSMGDKAINLQATFFDSLLKDDEKRLTNQGTASSNAYNRVISSFLDNNELLARALADLLQSSEISQEIDQLTYSTIPGLFGYLWSSESGEKYAKFIEELFKVSPDKTPQFIRVIFAVPPFRQFFDAVMADLVNSIQNVTDQAKADEFAVEFLKKWNEHSQFCPGIVKRIISLSDQPDKCLIDSFLEPAFNSPRSFGIVPLSFTINPEAMGFIKTAVLAKSSELWDIIASSQNSSQLFSSKRLSDILPDLGKTALFSNEDLHLLGLLSKSAKKIDPNFTEITQSNQPDSSPVYQVFPFSIPIVQENQHNGQPEERRSEDDEIEYQLREMLTGVDVIPIPAQSNDKPNMIELLKSQVQLARPDNRLLLEMKIDDFEASHNNRQNRMNFQQFLELLKEKFKERQPQRLEKLSKISLYNSEYTQMEQLTKTIKKSIDEYRDVLRLYLVEKWTSESPIQCDDDLCKISDPKFRTFFRGIVDNFKEWCASQQYQHATKVEILHNIVMTQLPLSRFLTVNPEFVTKDTLCHDGIHNQKDQLLEQNTFDFTETFQQNPKLLDTAKKQLQQAFDAPLPLLKLQYFSDALNSLVFVLTFEGHKEVGADQWLPMAILLLVQAEPEQLPSTIAYIDHFVKPSSSEQDDQLRLMPENIEYTFTMIKSALMHFQKSIDGIGIPEEQ
ncbi:hypothetical protein GPJ56_001527 [Histomonas meleagridis]|uniref:uncharacterized protein n=1 Tax=Histomonas meleagridis TaxID=135588 RepID=UPI00355A9340|nr:hypothetical protein GPJ56_001527 [Histomonas meleagridis]KAH0807034.1 hypothetical protein GO595_000210 [Histomonas meleagridis]